MTEERHDGKRPRGRKRKSMLDKVKVGESYYDIKRKAKDKEVLRELNP